MDLSPSISRRVPALDVVGGAGTREPAQELAIEAACYLINLIR